MREEFEKLPAIKRAMKDGSVEWDDGDGCYGGDDDYCSGYVNGAWYAYQEQQKKIEKAVLSLRNEFNLWADDTEQFHAIEAQIEQFEELLK